MTPSWRSSTSQSAAWSWRAHSYPGPSTGLDRPSPSLYTGTHSVTVFLYFCISVFLYFCIVFTETTYLHDTAGTRKTCCLENKNSDPVLLEEIEEEEKEEVKEVKKQGEEEE